LISVQSVICGVHRMTSSRMTLYWLLCAAQCQANTMNGLCQFISLLNSIWLISEREAGRF